MNEGIRLEETSVLNIAPFSDIGTPKKIIRLFGGMGQYQNAVNELQRNLYDVPPELLYQSGQGGNSAARQI